MANSGQNQLFTQSFESHQYRDFFSQLYCASYVVFIDFFLSCIYDLIVVCLQYVFVCYHTTFAYIWTIQKVWNYLNTSWKCTYIYIYKDQIFGHDWHVCECRSQWMKILSINLWAYYLASWVHILTISERSMGVPLRCELVPPKDL